MTSRVVVIGGGISGLSVAYAVLRNARKENRAVSVTLLETRGWLGGNIKTEREGEFLIESGPDSFVTTRPEALTLCRELGLEDALIETIPANRRVYMAHQGALSPFPKGLTLGIPTNLRSFLQTPLISRRGKLRALSEMWRGV